MVTGALAWRRAPNPRGSLLRSAIFALILGGIFLISGVQELHLSGQGAYGWELIAIAPVSAVAYMALAFRLRVGERERAEQVYGPEWRLLTTVNGTLVHARRIS